MTRRFAWLFALAVLAWTSDVRAAETKAKVYVLLWFDTEDYILPASDDATLKVANFLTKEGVKATFKIVGEKARTLEKRKRDDVIASLKKHEIGYHSNWHSVPPTPAQYLADLGWEDGVAEFVRREGPGRDDVERIFGQAPSCYGQPGSSWGPQSYGALRKWNMIYLDAGSHVNLDAKPCYYDGVLNLYKLEHTLRVKLEDPKDLEPAKDRFLASRKKLQEEGGGVVSIYYHPCEFVHKEFWDGVNFRKGANPARENWKLPPTKTAEETKQAYENFEAYIRFIKRFDDVEFITAREAAGRYRDKAMGRSFDRKALAAVAAAAAEDVNFQKHGDHALSAAEALALLSEYVAAGVAGKAPESMKLASSPIGPTGASPALTEPVKVDRGQFGRTCGDVAAYLKKRDGVPSTVWVGSTGVPPEAFLPVVARAARTLLEGKELPAEVEFKPVKFAVGKYVAADDPKLWGWVIFPPNFRAPALMELARRQAWTLKPALLHRD